MVGMYEQGILLLSVEAYNPHEGKWQMLRSKGVQCCRSEQIQELFLALSVMNFDLNGLMR